MNKSISELVKEMTKIIENQYGISGGYISITNKGDSTGGREKNDSDCQNDGGCSDTYNSGLCHNMRALDGTVMCKGSINTGNSAGDPCTVHVRSNNDFNPTNIQNSTNIQFNK